MIGRPLAYLDRWSFDPGEKIEVRASGNGKTEVDLVSLYGLEGAGVPTAYKTRLIPCGGPVELMQQNIVKGSWAETHDGPHVEADEEWQWSLTILPTLTDSGTLLEWGRNAVMLRIGEGRLHVMFRGAAIASVPLVKDSWSQISLTSRQRTGQLSITACGNDSWHRTKACCSFDIYGEAIRGPLVIGRGFNGKIERPVFEVEGAVAANWNFADDMKLQSVPGYGQRARRLMLVGAPRRGVTGSGWDGTAHDWTTRPDHYGAIHFHDDDLDDCRWQPSCEIDVPSDVESGIYAIRLSNSEGQHHVPLFVRPRTPPPVVFLASTFSYLAYGNSLWASPSAADIIEQFPYDAATMQACGLSTYSRHRDGSGISQVSLRRPLLNATPGFLGEAIGGQVLFNDDLRIIDWLARTATEHAVISDHDLHERGVAALGNARVIVTGAHPEYHSRESLDALTRFAAEGGRILYLGGNGFYWRVAPLPEAPHVIELRRAENGIRIWTEPHGEYVHQADGLRGGTWRQLGRPPNRLVGVGFSAQGDITPSEPFVPTPAAQDPRVAFLFKDVAPGPLGFPGPTGAAGGYELDRADIRLGTPKHALVVARTRTFGEGMAPVNEERLTHTLVDAEDPLRADLTFFEGPNGGAVLSTGSILFAGCLEEEHGAARLAENALRRFVDPTIFVLPVMRDDDKNSHG